MCVFVPCAREESPGTALKESLDSHDDVAGRIRTNRAGIFLEPIAVFQMTLFGREERQGRLQGIETEVTVGWDVESPFAQVEAVSWLHP